MAISFSVRGQLRYCQGNGSAARSIFYRVADKAYADFLKLGRVAPYIGVLYGDRFCKLLFFPAQFPVKNGRKRSCRNFLQSSTTG